MLYMDNIFCSITKRDKRILAIVGLSYLNDGASINVV